MAAVDGVCICSVDGWTQMLVYRKDLFDAAGLEAPFLRKCLSSY